MVRRGRLFPEQQLLFEKNDTVITIGKHKISARTMIKDSGCEFICFDIPYS